MRIENLIRHTLILGLLIAIGVASRFFLIDVPNFKPIAAIILFAAFWFRSIWVAGLLVPVIMLISNAALDHCPWQVTTGVFGGLMVAALLGRRLRGRSDNPCERSVQSMPRVSRLLSASLAMSLSFFVISNFAVWAMGSWYPLTAEGLVACYVAAIPFLKYTLFGDLLFTGVIFSACYAICVLCSFATSDRLGYEA